VHVEGGGASVRVNPLTLEIMDEQTEFSQTVVRKIVMYVAEHQNELFEKWMEYNDEED
jgi:hypothetical protein